MILRGEESILPPPARPPDPDPDPAGLLHDGAQAPLHRPGAVVLPHGVLQRRQRKRERLAPRDKRADV